MGLGRIAVAAVMVVGGMIWRDGTQAQFVDNGRVFVKASVQFPTTRPLETWQDLTDRTLLRTQSFELGTVTDTFCVFQDPTRKLPITDGWQIALTPLQLQATQATVRVDWKRFREQGRQVSEVTGSRELVIYLDDAVALDHIPATRKAAGCSATGMTLFVGLHRLTPGR